MPTTTNPNDLVPKLLTAAANLLRATGGLCTNGSYHNAATGTYCMLGALEEVGGRCYGVDPGNDTRARAASP